MYPRNHSYGKILEQKKIKLIHKKFTVSYKLSIVPNKQKKPYYHIIY